MQKTTVGSIEVTALVDLIQAYPATTVYPDLGDPARFAKHLKPDGAVELAFVSFLVRDGDTLLLVDTGWGPENNGKLLEELAAAGVKPDEITHVLFTHLHGDHTGWNMDRASGKPIFANARHLVPQGDWDHYAKEAEAARAKDTSGKPWLGSFDRDVEPLEGFGLLDLISGEHVISTGLTSVPTPGHTPGHTSVAVTSGEERGFILGDVVLTQVDAAEPTLQSVFDGDRALAVKTRQATIERLIADRALVGASHLPAPGLGRFVRAEGRQWWEAV
jgi:glyoxylase-like metal-dependent hydrolase (beta-lactamase superfamily II)